MLYRVQIGEEIAGSNLKNFPPEIKRKARKALNELAEDPYRGKELEENLAGFRSWRFLRYRIVYKIETDKKVVKVWSIAHRSTVYEQLAHALQELAEQRRSP